MSNSAIQVRSDKSVFKSFKDQMSLNYFWIKKECLDKNVILELHNTAKDNYKRGLFKPAQIGALNHTRKDIEVRGDEIFWIESWDCPALLELNRFLKELMQEIRCKLYLPVRRFESHFAHYPIGKSYKRHFDNSIYNRNRLVSCVLYIGPWTLGNGGELIFYDEEDRKKVFIPQQGTVVVFDSSLEHEVKKTTIPRWTITTWFRNDLDPMLRL